MTSMLKPTDHRTPNPDVFCLHIDVSTKSASIMLCILRLTLVFDFAWAFEKNADDNLPI